MQERERSVWRAVCGEWGSSPGRSGGTSFSFSFSFSRVDWTQLWAYVGARASTHRLWAINILSQLWPNIPSIPTGPTSTVFLFIRTFFILKPTQPGFYITDFRHQELTHMHRLFLRTFHLLPWQPSYWVIPRCTIRVDIFLPPPLTTLSCTDLTCAPDFPPRDALQIS